MPTVQSDHNFIDKFLLAVHNSPEQIAFEYEGTDIRYTYSEFHQKIELWKGYFESLHVQKGDKVFILLAEELEFILSFYALSSIGAVSAFFDVKCTDYELNQVLAEFDPMGIVTSSKYLGARTDFAENMGLQFVLVTDSLEGTVDDYISSKYITTEHLPQRPSALTAPESDTIISCHFTYKGFGYPLPVRHTYHHYSLFLEQACGIYPQQPGSTILVCLPYYPIYGLSSSVIFPLAWGSRLLSCTDISKKSILDLLITHQVSLVCLVPLLLKKLGHEAAMEDVRIRLNPSLEIISGGSYLEEQTQQDIYRHLGLKVYQGYGLTEAFPVTFNYKNKVRFGTVGAVIEGYTRIVIVDHDGQQLPIGSIGEIALEGRTISDGYYGRSEDTNRIFSNGYLYTGDVGFLDEEDFLHFVGRKYPFTKVTSKMVDLTEIENVIRDMPHVIDVRAVVRENKKFGELVHVTVKVPRDAPITEKELKGLLKKNLSKHKVPTKMTLCH